MGDTRGVRYPRAVVVGILAAALVCLWGLVLDYGFETSYQNENRDPYLISAQFIRLDPLLKAVPENAVLGYLTDVQPGSTTDTAMLDGAQYVLAPRLVLRGVGHEWVLGNFTRPADFAALGRSQGLTIKKDFGNGIVLFRGNR